jgi:glycosyltransferase involved in cell wall biosynthesis
MIVKNEEAMLARCLDSAAGLDEIVICDTGSEDKTVEIAKRYTDKVFTDYKWQKNFAEARNHAKKKSTTDWILSLDADEQLVSPVSNVRQAANLGFMAVNCSLLAEDNGQANPFPRLFRNSPQVWWNGAAHNHLSVLGEDVGSITPPDSLVHIKYGYSPAHNLDPNRTMDILEKDVRERGNEAVREMFYLGREYYYRRRYEDAVIMLGRYVQKSGFLAEKSEAFLMMALCYKSMSPPDMDSARDACLQALAINCRWWEPLNLMAELAGDGKGNDRWQKNADGWKLLEKHALNEGVLFLRTKP